MWYIIFKGFFTVYFTLVSPSPNFTFTLRANTQIITENLDFCKGITVGLKMYWIEKYAQLWRISRDLFVKCFPIVFNCAHLLVGQKCIRLYSAHTFLCAFLEFLCFFAYDMSALLKLTGIKLSSLWHVFALEYFHRQSIKTRSNVKLSWGCRTLLMGHSCAALIVEPSL